MGYRSNVAYVIKFRNKTVLNEFIALVMVKGENVADALRYCEIEKQDDDTYCVNYYIDGAKWYDSFPDVQGHEELMNFAVERFPDDAGYYFIRLGEEQDDTETEEAGNADMIPYDDFYVRREIVMPFNYDYEAIGDKLSVLD